jgi:hypothetical protein
MPYNYENLKSIFKDKKCVLLSSKEEISIKERNIKARFIASCGHENIVFVNVFISRNTGVICKECLYERDRNKKNQENFTEREIDFTRNFQEFISSSFESELTNEGCKSDLIIKPININEDNWMRIQIKTTKKNYNKSYGFNNISNYKDNIILCYCISEDIYWLIPYNELILTNKKINLSLSEKSKYYKYCVEKENIVQILNNYYKEVVLYNKKKCMISENICVKKEQLYNKKIYDNLSFLNIEKPEYTNMVYDLIVNNKKIQEKVLNILKNKNGYQSIICKRFGKEKMQNYIYQDNDFYWLHIYETEFFYVIPQYELLYRDIVAFFETEGRKSIYVHIEDTDYKHSWANEYLFNYKNINKQKLLKILENDYTEIEYSIMYIKIMEM